MAQHALVAANLFPPIALQAAPAQHGPASVVVDTMDLKDRHGEIQANRNNSGHGSTFWLVETLHPTPTFGEGGHAIKWAVQRARYMTLETIAPLSDDLATSLAIAGR